MELPKTTKRGFVNALLAEQQALLINLIESCDTLEARDSKSMACLAKLQVSPEAVHIEGKEVKFKYGVEKGKKLEVEVEQPIGTFKLWLCHRGVPMIRPRSPDGRIV